MTSTFRFRRYREEVALRSTQGIPKDDDKNEVPANDKKHDKSPRTKPSSDSENDDTNGTVIQNLCHTIIVVAACGKVFTEEKSKTNDQGDNYKNVSTESSKRDFTKGREPICVVPEGTTLLLRNLKDCHVTIRLPLPAVHFAGIETTEILFFNQGTADGNVHANTTIHMTDCFGKSSLQLETPAQQLRIHKAIGLNVAMMRMMTMNPRAGNSLARRDWTKGSIILEASKDVVFSVPPLPPPDEEISSSLPTTRESIVATTKTYWHQVVVKDFQWLRKGIASPNFRIEVFEIRNDENRRDIDCSGDTVEIVETVQDTAAPQTSNSEDADSSDSEDEL